MRRAKKKQQRKRVREWKHPVEWMRSQTSSVCCLPHITGPFLSSCLQSQLCRALAMARPELCGSVPPSLLELWTRLFSPFHSGWEPQLAGLARCFKELLVPKGSVHFCSFQQPQREQLSLPERSCTFSELGFDAHFYLSFELCHWVESLTVGKHQRMGGFTGHI